MDSIDYKKVLVVDDEQDLCEVLECQVADLGFETLVCYDGEEAFEKLKNFPAFLVISDINMPKLNGIELLEKIKGMPGPKPYVILCTGFSGYSRDELVQLGAIEVFHKPFDFEVFEKFLINLRSKE